MPARYSRRPGPPATPPPSPAPDSPAPLHVRRTRRMGTQTRRAPPGHQVRRLPHLDLTLGTPHRAGGRSRSAVGYQLRSPASLVSPVPGRMKAESCQQPGEASARRMADAAGAAGAAGEQGRMSCRAGTAIGALPSFLRLTVTPRRDGADDHHGITPTRGATDCPVRHGTGQPPRPPGCRP